MPSTSARLRPRARRATTSHGKALIALAITAVAAGCGLPGEAELADLDPPTAASAPNTTLDDWIPCQARPPSAPTCDSAPELCDLSAQLVLVPDEDAVRPVHLVFVAEGFVGKDLPRFRSAVIDLLRDAAEIDDGLFGGLLGALRVSVVAIPSETSAVLDDDLDNTALGGCLLDNAPRGPRLHIDRPRAVLAAREAAGDDVDAVIVVLDTVLGQANATRPGSRTATELLVSGAAEDVITASIHPSMSVVVLPRDANGGLLEHELGHALLHLGDEYAHEDGCYAPTFAELPTTADPLWETANLSLSAGGAKWADLVSGSKSGGRGYRDCVYHPTDRCRMLASATSGFCPVCAREVTRLTDARHRSAQDGTPGCELTMTSRSTLRPQEGPASLTGLSVRVEAKDQNLPLVLELYDRSTLIGTFTSSAAFAAAEVRVGLDAPIRDGGDQTDELLTLVCTDALGASSVAALPLRAGPG